MCPAQSEDSRCRPAQLTKSALPLGSVREDTRSGVLAAAGILLLTSEMLKITMEQFSDEKQYDVCVWCLELGRYILPALSVEDAESMAKIMLDDGHDFHLLDRRYGVVEVHPPSPNEGAASAKT